MNEAHTLRFVVAVRGAVGLFFRAVRSCGAEASEPRQALIGATVVCPHLPQFPDSIFFPHTFVKIAVEHFHFLPYQWRQMLQFSLFNIPIRVEPWFWVILAMLGGGMGADSKEAMVQILMFLVAGFISILVHELGHALTARHFGHRVNILLHGFGGLAFYQGGVHTRQRTFLITAAGPAIQVVLGLAVLAYYERFAGMSPQAREFLWILYRISLIWALLNLLPILPLDGGRLLESLLGPGKIRITLTVSLVTAVAAFFYCITTGRIFGAILTATFAFQSFKELRQPSWR